MRVVCVDLELNQPTRKILQIGAVCFQPDNGKIVETFNQFVNPGEAISPQIVSLTGITDEIVKDSPNIVEAACYFNSFKNKLQINPIGIVWGAGASNDISMIFEESGVESSFRSRIIDVKAVFQMLANASGAHLRQQTGLKRACEVLNLGWDSTYGEPHNALADAYNTYRVYMLLSKCLKGAVDIKLG